MSGIFNQFHQPVGMTLSDWKGAPFPRLSKLQVAIVSLNVLTPNAMQKSCMKRTAKQAIVVTGHIWRSGLLRPSIPSWIM